MSRKDQVIGLISISDGENTAGDALKNESLPRQVFAEKKSIQRNEFYQAAATGFRPKLTFVVWTREYDDEQRLEYNDKTYDIIRTFEPNSEDTELVCQGPVNRSAAPS